MSEKSNLGRKPLSKKVSDDLEENIDDDIIPRRRGRKPKERFGLIKSNFEKPPKDEEYVILQLLISSKDLDDVEFVEDKATKYSSTITDPISYFPSMNCEVVNQELDKNISNEYSREELMRRFDNIKENNPEHPNQQRISKQIKLMMQYKEEKNDAPEWPHQTDIFCFWCCNPFTGVPWGIPVKLINGVFHVDGNFCSPECAAAHNHEQKDSSMWDRYQLLNMLYNMVMPFYKKLVLAPPRRLLRQFGGYMTIEEFRQCSNQYLKDYQVNFPPMVPIPSYGEETPLSDIYKPQVVLIDSKRIDDANKRLIQHEENLKNEKQSMYSCLNRITTS